MTPKLKPLQPGDRVAAYIGGTVDIKPHRVIARVKNVTEQGVYIVMNGVGIDAASWFVHPKQLRRLRPKRKRRRVWISESMLRRSVHEVPARIDGQTWADAIEFREVPRKPRCPDADRPYDAMGPCSALRCPEHGRKGKA